jgi:hypothetical protein
MSWVSSGIFCAHLPTGSEARLSVEAQCLSERASFCQVHV